jgi:hypothetical protein
MQDRYTGDVGDFGKYGLLRLLCGKSNAPALKLGVVWYLVPNESHNQDGKHTRYILDASPDFRDCDRELYDGLKKLLVDQSGKVHEERRTVKLIEESHLLPPGTIFYSARLEYYKEQPRAERLSVREKWLEAALKETASADVVFLDPDNGIECRSVSRSEKKGPKYVFWDEVERFSRRNQSMVVYHHLGRSRSWKQQVERLRKEFLDRIPQTFGMSVFTYKRGSGRVYFVATACNEHQQILRGGLRKLLAPPWNRHFNGSIAT